LTNRIIDIDIPQQLVCTLIAVLPSSVHGMNYDHEWRLDHALAWYKLEGP